MKAAGYQSTSVTLGASGFQERKEVWGHPAPLPPFSSKQPGRADNAAVPPAAQEFGATSHTHCLKHKISPRFLSHKSHPRCRGRGGGCRCRPALVRGAEWHHTLAMPQFHPSASYWQKLGVTGLGLLLGCTGGCGKVLGDVFPAGLPRHKVGNPGVRLNRDAAGQRGVMGTCCSHMPRSSATISHRTQSRRPANQQGTEQSHQTNGALEQHRGRIRPLCHHPAMQSAPGGSRDWSSAPAPPRY